MNEKECKLWIQKGKPIEVEVIENRGNYSIVQNSSGRYIVENSELTPLPILQDIKT